MPRASMISSASFGRLALGPTCRMTPSTAKRPASRNTVRRSSIVTSRSVWRTSSVLVLDLLRKYASLLEERPNVGNDGEEARGFPGGGAARAREVDADFLGDAAGARRHDEHPVGEEHGLLNIVGDEDDALARLVPDAVKKQHHLLA